MRLLAIGNPVAGGGQAVRLITETTELLKARGHRCETFLTGAVGDARQRVSRLDPACEAIVVAGGDGTLNEVVNGLEDPPQLPIAFMSAGTGNVIGCELGLAGTPAEVVQAIETGSTRRLDVGRAGARRFLMLASAGFDALVTEEVQKTRRGTFWRGAYAYPILRALVRYRPPKLTVAVDDQEALSGALVIVSKTPYYGGIFMIARRARCDSGHFDVCVFRRAGFLNLARIALSGLRNTMRRVPGITYVTGRHVEITADRPTAVELDGDYFGSTPLTLDLEPAALAMFVPRKTT